MRVGQIFSPLLLSIALAAAPAAAKPRYAATITRTAEGVAHVEARDYAGLGYGSGYTAAEDNGCVIADTLITARGERALFFGRAGKATVGFVDIPNIESDFFHRIIGDLPRLEKSLATTSRDNRAMIDGFAAGYNRYLKDHRAGFAASCRDAEWLRPMSHDDALLLLNAAMVQGSAAPYARFIAGAQPAAAPVTASLPPSTDAQGLGSNGWAFGKARTGGPGILVGNPHFPWNGVNRFRRLHMILPGKFDAMGAALAASPFITIGFNKDVAWTHTVTTSQHQTLYQLALDPADPTAYRLDGRREAMTKRQLSVSVKGEPSVTRTVYASRYGPLIALGGTLGWGKDYAYAFADANQANFRSGDAWLGIARARNVEQIRDTAARTLGIPYVNTVAADRAGHALYADISAIPNVSAAKFDRCGIGEGSKPDSETPSLTILDGAAAACAWDVDPASPVPGLMPLKHLPVLIREDYVQNSNDSYWLTNPAQPFPALAPILGPHGNRQSLRMRSANKGFAAPGKIDPATARTLTLENKVEAAALVLDDLLALCPQRPVLAPACAALAGWDRRADNNSKGALLFFSWWRRASALKDVWATPFDPARPVATPYGLNPAQAAPILDALQAAVDELVKFKAPLDAPLGAYQIAPRGTERIAIHGGPSFAGVLNAMHAAPTLDGLVPFHGSSYIQVVTFDANGPVADSMLAYSQSSNPESPHYADGTHAYSEKRWLVLPFTPAQIAAQREAEPLRISE